MTRQTQWPEVEKWDYSNTWHTIEKPATVTQHSMRSSLTQVCRCNQTNILGWNVSTWNHSTCSKSIYGKKVNWTQTTQQHESTIDKHFFRYSFFLFFVSSFQVVFFVVALTRLNISHEFESFNAMIAIWEMFNFRFVFMFAFECLIRLLEIPFFFSAKENRFE